MQVAVNTGRLPLTRGKRVGYRVEWLRHYNGLYERFTDPDPHSFVTFRSTTKLGLGLQNKVMNTCEQARTGRDGKRGRVFLVGFSSSIARFIVSSLRENKPGNRVIVISMGCFN